MLYFPTTLGTGGFFGYKVATTLHAIRPTATHPSYGVKIIGDTQQGSNINFAQSGSCVPGFVVDLSASGIGATLVMQDLTVYLQSGSGSGVAGITYTTGGTNTPWANIERVRVIGPWGGGIKINQLTSNGDGAGGSCIKDCQIQGDSSGGDYRIMQYGIFLNGLGGMTIDHCSITFCSTGINLTAPCEEVRVMNCSLVNVLVGMSYVGNNGGTPQSGNTWALNSHFNCGYKGIVIGDSGTNGKREQNFVDNCYFLNGNNKYSVWHTGAGAPSSSSLVNAGSFTAGIAYTIATLGTTDWVAAGAASNTVGIQFIAINRGGGTGTAESYNNCDYYKNTSNGDVYWKFGGSWGSPFYNVANQSDGGTNSGSAQPVSGAISAIGVCIELYGGWQNVRGCLALETGSGFYYQGVIVNGGAYSSVDDLTIMQFADSCLILGGGCTYSHVSNVRFKDTLGATAILNSGGGTNQIHACFGMNGNTDGTWASNPY